VERNPGGKKRELPLFERWTEVDEVKVTELEKFKIEIRDTALGR